MIDIQRKCFEKSNNVNPDWSFKFDEELQQYIALCSEMKLQVDEFNEHWDTFRAGWQAAQADVVPECAWRSCFDGGVFNTDCGHTFELSNNDSLDGNNFKHCFYCGGKIKAQESSHD